ncbi:MAG: rod shape-determining protein RodA [Gammaproteobacteria bacterium]
MFRNRIDRPLFTALILLALVGLVVLFSASGGDWRLVGKQASWVAVGFALMIAFTFTPPRYFRIAAPFFYGLTLLLLLAVLALGATGKGAVRWLDVGIVQFQPAELMKIALPLTLAAFFHDRAPPPRWRPILIAVVLITVPAALIAIEPDLGTAILIIGAGAGVLFLAGLPLRWIITFSILIGATLPLGWHFLHEYQRERLLIFLDPQSDPLGAGYHIIQSKIAIGSGSLFGQGFLGGSQAQLDFLPERTTDFVFAVFAEQFGFAGVIALIALFAFIVGRGYVLVARTHTRFGRLFTAGMITTFLLYVVINVGMVAGVVPVVGVPLPLISYGGSSVVTVLASFGILLSIAAHRRLIDT